MTALDHAIWWQVYPLGATGAPIRGDHSGDQPQHRLRRLEPWLDHVIELGCSGILLGPIFASSTHGYDTLDHCRLDPRLGDESDWAHLVEQAHRRGLTIMLDGVFNHVGVLHPLVAEGPGMVAFEGDHPRSWEGHGDLAELDHSDPRVADLVVDVMRHWLDRGAGGWRLDVAYAVPSEFWRDVLARVRETHPEAMFLGEVIHGDYGQIVTAGTLDAVTQYELWKALWSSQRDRNLWELAWALERHAEFTAAAASTGAIMQTFTSNHDTDRIASLAGPEGAAIAAAMVMTVPGMPSVYYGDEFGFEAVRGSGAEADDPVRPPLPATPGDVLTDRQWLQRLTTDLIGLRRRNSWVTRGDLSVVDKTNETLHHRVTSGGDVLDVFVWLSVDETPAGFSIEVNGAEQLRWTAA